MSDKFVPGLNSYYDVGKSTSFNLASQLDAGLMSTYDFCKLQTIVIPPPSITLTSNNCNTVIKGGIIGIVSGDNYIKVDSSVDIKQNEDGSAPATYENIPLKIHGNTYGVRFSLDIDRLSSYLIKNGRLILKGTVGKTGDVGDKGPTGDDYILSGPKGNDGLPGTTPPINLVVENENIDVVNVGSTGITDINPLIGTDGTYDLVITRQPIGDSEVSTNRINVAGTETNWAVVVSGPGANRQVYYLDLNPITTSVYNRSTIYAELIKKGYEDAVKFWIKTMSELFDSQKEALCCALDRCKSRIKNDALRRHFESTSATAKPDYKTIIKTRLDDPETITSTSILKDLYPDGEFCKEPDPICGMIGSITPNTTSVNCSSSSVYISGTIKYTTLEKDISDVLTLKADVGSVSPSSLTKKELLAGATIKYSCAAAIITVTSSGKCVVSDDLSLPDLPDAVCEFGTGEIVLTSADSACTPGQKYTGIIKYDTLSADTGPFNLVANVGVVTPSTATRSGLLTGLSISFDCTAGVIEVVSTGTCTNSDIVKIPPPGIIFVPRVCRNLNIVLAIDVTGSMGATIANVVSGLTNIINTMASIDPDARISIVTFDDNAALALPLTSIKNIDAIQAVIDNLRASGGGDIPEGLGAAIDLSLKQFDKLTSKTIANLIITITDAVAREGRDFLSSISSQASAREIPIFALTGLDTSALSDAMFLANATKGFWSSNLSTDKFIVDVLKALEYWCSYDEKTASSVETVSILKTNEHESTKITLDSSSNLGASSNAVSLELPKGMYKIGIVDTDLFINGKFNALVRILTTKGLSTRSMDFINKGSFDSVDDSRFAYINNTVVVDHDGGLLRAYILGSNDSDNAGSVTLSVMPMRITLNSNQLLSLKSQIKNNIVRVKNIEVDISMDGVNTGVQTSFEFNGTILVPTKNN